MGYRIPLDAHGRDGYGACSDREPVTLPPIGCLAWEDRKYAILPMRYEGGSSNPPFMQALDAATTHATFDIFERSTAAPNMAHAFTLMGGYNLINPWGLGCYGDPGCSDPPKAGMGQFSPVPPTIPYNNPRPVTPRTPAVQDARYGGMFAVRKKAGEPCCRVVIYGYNLAEDREWENKVYVDGEVYTFPETTFSTCLTEDGYICLNILDPEAMELEFHTDLDGLPDTTIPLAHVKIESGSGSNCELDITQIQYGAIVVGGGAAGQHSWRLFKRTVGSGEEPTYQLSMSWGLIRIGKILLRYPFKAEGVGEYAEYMDVAEYPEAAQSVWLLLSHDSEVATNCFMDDEDEPAEEPPEPENFGFSIEVSLYGAGVVLQGTNNIYPVLIGTLDSDGRITQHRREDIDVVGRLV